MLWGSGRSSGPAPLVSDSDLEIYVGDAREVLAELPNESVDCCVTSPPYFGLRDYGAEGQLGLEATPAAYVEAMTAVFAEVRRVLTPAGTLWLNIGDSYSHGGNGARDPERWPKQSRNDHRVEHPNKAAGKPKDMLGIPWKVAFALQADGWYLRSDIIWAKPNPMPESVTDRPTKAHEYVFLLSKSPRYFYDAAAIAEPAASGFNERWDASEANGTAPTTRNARTVWSIPTEPYAKAHFATFPTALARRCILAGCPEGGTVLDCFLGSGTTALVARKHGRRCLGIELNPAYAAMAAGRCSQLSLLAGLGGS